MKVWIPDRRKISWVSRDVSDRVACGSNIVLGKMYDADDDADDGNDDDIIII